MHNVLFKKKNLKKILDQVFESSLVIFIKYIVLTQIWKQC